MSHPKSRIPYYNEINEFLASTPFPNRTADPDFYCLRVKLGDDVKEFYKPPFRRSFYFLALIGNAENSQIIYDNLNKVSLNSTVVFQAPGLISSFRKTHTSYGHLVYFKTGCFSFFKPDLEKEFPFFDLHQTNFLELSQQKFNSLTPLFEDVFQAYEKTPHSQHQIARVKLLALLYQLKDFFGVQQKQDRSMDPQLALLKKFVQLVNNNYLEKRTVEEYAELLSVTAKHLSRVIKESSGKNALAHINERIVSEAKSLILYTDLDMTEVCYRLNFSDPANFSKFFKKQVGTAPLEFKKQNVG